MIRVLVTGFERYGNEPINPSRLLAERLDGQVIGRAQVYGYTLPVSYNRIKKAVKHLLEDVDPDIVLSFGLSPQRSVVSIERIALNYAYSRIPDNDGVLLRHEKIIDNGPIALESTIDAARVAGIFLDNGVPATVSYHAGTFLCNYVFYLLLYYSINSNRRVGFIHIPYTHEISVKMLKGDTPRITPSVDEERLLYAIRRVILYVSEENRFVSASFK